MLNTQKLAQNKQLLIFVAAFSLTAVIFLLAQILASAESDVFEAENANRTTSALLASDIDASNGKYILFTSSNGPGPTPGETKFFDDFVDPNWQERYDFDIFHRDDVLGIQKETGWPGDHVETGPNDMCSAPEEKRLIFKGDRATDFNDDWIYRCEPGGDPAKAHLMTSIGGVAGYSIGSFTPKPTFTDVTEIRWDINITDIGGRQFPEVKVMPAANFDPLNLPCTLEHLPCGTQDHGELGSVGTSFSGHGLYIHNGIDYDASESWFKPWVFEGDPALSSIRTRREHFFKDNQNGTMTFGIQTPGGGDVSTTTCRLQIGFCEEIEEADGTRFFTYTVPGSFPSGPVRIVFADHNYTPSKDCDDMPCSSYTWHWDNIVIK